MAQKKKTTARSGSSSRSGKSAAGRSKRPQPDLAQSWSILLFGLGAVFITMGFVEGQSAWAWLRSVLFGVFGFSMYLLGPLMLYLAVLVALGRPIWNRLAKSLLLMMILCGTSVVFSTIDLVDISFGRAVVLLYENGQSLMGGGLIGGIVGGTLLALCGHPAANILLLVFLVAMLMYYSG